MIGVVLVGLGRIGSTYDSGVSRDAPRSHAGAILRSNAYTLLAVCDPDEYACSRFCIDWDLNVPAFATVDEAMRTHAPDLAVIATSRAAQYSVLRDVIGHPIRFVVCEKPFCNSLVEAETIRRRAAAASIPIVVNFHRRWDQRFLTLRQRIEDLGRPRLVKTVYNKGLINYGTHLIDLLHYLFGPVLSVGHASKGSSGDDPSYSAVITFTSGLEVAMDGLDGVDYELFELEIFYPSRKITVEFGGVAITEQLAAMGRHYQDYVSLSVPRDVVNSAQVSGLAEAYDGVASYFEQGRFPTDAATDRTCLDVWRVVDAIIRCSEQGVGVVL